MIIHSTIFIDCLLCPSIGNIAMNKIVRDSFLMLVYALVWVVGGRGIERNKQVNKYIIYNKIMIRTM